MTAAPLPDPQPRETGARDGVRLYWRVAGAALAAVAAVGILLVAVGRDALLGDFLRFQAGQNVLFAALAVTAVFLGFSNVDHASARRAARAFAALHLALALVGVLAPTLLGLGDALAVRFEPGDALLHLVIGAWGLHAGLRG